MGGGRRSIVMVYVMQSSSLLPVDWQWSIIGEHKTQRWYRTRNATHSRHIPRSSGAIGLCVRHRCSSDPCPCGECLVPVGPRRHRPDGHVLVQKLKKLVCTARAVPGTKTEIIIVTIIVKVNS